MKFKTLMIAALMLGIAGCGCTDDTTPPGAPAPIPAAGLVKTQMPPVLLPPPVVTAPFKIDVTFVLDDSDTMVNRTLGLIPANLGDRRERSQAAQAIMRRIEQTLRTRIENEYAAENLPVPPLDFAFAVARYEDFGGSFTVPLRRTGDVDDPANKNNDQDARPFILNMPILRQAHPEFAARFADAIARTAPGDGNPYIRLAGNPDLFRVYDPQSGLEALYQVAAPQNPNGTYGGFDADGNNSTLDSGPPTSLDALRNPQTRPGASGDVPAVGYQVIDPADADYTDPDGEPLFRILDETGTVVTNVAAPGGPPAPSIASGNLGGVGWRPDAARFVILATDIATVAPTETTPLGTPELPGILPPPALSETISSSDGAPDAPRGARDVLTLAFDGGVQTLVGGFPLTERRTGVADGPSHLGGGGVAPVGAATIQQTIDALNALDIEVLLMGTPFVGGLDTKPGETGVNGDIDADIPSDQFDPSNPSVVQSDLAPWFWMNAVSRLTTPEVTSIALGGAQETFPGVYNVATVWPFNPADAQGTDESNIKNTVTDDLTERVRDWVDNGYATGGTSTVPLASRDALPESLPFTFTMTLDTPVGTPDVVQAAPLSGMAPQTSFTATGLVPVYWNDDPAIPAGAFTEVRFPSLAEGLLQYAPRDDTVVLPASRAIDVLIDAAFDGAYNYGVGVTPSAANEALIEDAIKVRGDGTNPIANATDAINMATAVVTAIVREDSAPGPGFELTSVANGCAIVSDQTVNQDPTDQVGGTCPFP